MTRNNMPEFVKQWFISMCHRMKPKDVNGVKPTRFLNKDIAPTPLIRATFDTATFSAYWYALGHLPFTHLGFAH